MEISLARTGWEGLEQISAHPPDVVLLDVGLPDLSGLDVYQRLRRIDTRIPVIFITGSATTDTEIEAIRQGAYDYLLKPIDLSHLDKVVRDALELGRRMREPTSVGEPPAEGDDAIIGRSPAMQEVYKSIGRVADKNVTVLITGESGTGKELVAKALYQHSSRAQSPFLAINCAAIPESLLESEMFGHEKGAFTGADRRRIGKFEQCNGGTIFLDEVGDMPLLTQGKILRLLQDQPFERLGGNETVQTDVRLIAATNRDLKSSAVGGRFRSDLYYRLSVFNIHLPPLRDRGDDLPLLVHFYLHRFKHELGHHVRDVAADAMGRLSSYAWPGNVRELQSVLKQAILRAHGPVLLPEFLPAFPEPPRPHMPAAPPGGGFDPEAFLPQRLSPDSRDLYAEFHHEVDRRLLVRVLEYTGGNQLRAALLLGISRRTLRHKLQELSLHVRHSVVHASEPTYRGCRSSATYPKGL
jgi:two-component system nitrogen regulation response regulator GlnG